MATRPTPAQLESNRFESGMPQEVDDILPHIGAYGRYQIFIQVIFALVALPETLQGLVMFYAADTPPWVCTSNNTSCEFGRTYSADDHIRCELPRDSWSYTQGPEYSIVTEFGLDCQSAWLAQLPTSIFYLGTALGSVAIGWCGDNFGRRTVLLPSIFFIQVFGFISTFSPRVEYLVAFRFIIGFFVPGAAINMSTMLSELVIPKHRAWAGPALFLLWPLGLGLMSLAAYFIPNWKFLMLIVSAPMFISVLLAYFVPESIRWLLAKGREGEAIELLQKTARWNRKSLPSNIKLVIPRKTKQSGPRDLFSDWKMATLTVIIGIKWFGVGLVYYGIPMSSDDITNGSMYVNFTLTCMIELPALFSCSYMLNKFGRRFTTIGSFFFTGVTCLFIGLAPQHWDIARLVVGVLGRFSVALTFASIYTWTLELYPTLLRSQGIGFGSICSKVGCTSMPWIVKSTKQLHHMTPFLSMGTLAVAVSLILIKLPETKGRHFSSSPLDISSPSCQRKQSKIHTFSA